MLFDPVFCQMERFSDCSHTLFLSACLRGERQQFQKQAIEALQRYEFRFHTFAISQRQTAVSHALLVQFSLGTLHGCSRSLHYVK